MCDCLFCKIIAGEIPSGKVYEDENVFAFKDINPQAPVHVLIVPKKHVENVLEAAKTAPETIDAVMRALPRVAEAAGVEQAVCSCSEKCAAGAVNTECAVCSVNMEKCVGVEPEPVETEEPVPEEAEPETGGNMGMLLAVLAVALVGGGAAFYFKVLRPKQQKAAEPQEDYGDELPDYDGPDGYGDEDDDGPPWDEEDEGGEEADK